MPEFYGVQRESTNGLSDNDDCTWNLPNVQGRRSQLRMFLGRRLPRLPWGGAVNSRDLFAELKRRNVCKVGIAYAVVAWLLMQVASQIFPFFEIPNWAVRLVVLLLVIGFPIALILAWAFELTPEGIKRSEDVDLSKSVTRATGRKLDFTIIGVLLVVIGIFAYQRFGPQKKIPAVAPELLEKSIAVLPFENLSRDP